MILNNRVKLEQNKEILFDFVFKFKQHIWLKANYKNILNLNSSFVLSFHIQIIL